MQILLQVCPTLLKQDAFLQQHNSDDLLDSESTQRIAGRKIMQGRHSRQLEPSATALFGGHQQCNTRLDGNQASMRWGKAR